MVCSQAKVSDLHVIIRVKEDVDRLQIPVNHALKERKMDEKICLIIRKLKHFFLLNNNVIATAAGKKWHGVPKYILMQI